MTASELRDKLLRQLWSPTSAQTPTYIHKDIATAVNQAFQVIWGAPNLDYLRRKISTFSTVNGQQAYTLSQNLLQIIGPVSSPSWPLIPLNHKGDLSNFTARFLQADTDAQSGGPRAYYLERLYSSDSDADPVTVKMLLAPTPTSAVTITYEAAYEPPSFTDCDLDEDATLPIPHGFVETLLLPIAAWHLKSSHWFKKGQMVNSEPYIDQQYRQALTQLGLVDPQISAAKPAQPQPINP